MYAFSENFMLPLSHDEVVHLKKSLLSKMPGDEWQQFANMRTLLAYMYTHPGTKLLFMGNEFGQLREWNHEHSIDWHLLKLPRHTGLQLLMRDINLLYRSEPALYSKSFSSAGFEWMKVDDANHSVLIYCRKGLQKGDVILVALNLTPVPRYGYRTSIPLKGQWNEIMNTDDQKYGGSGFKTVGDLQSQHIAMDKKNYSVVIDLPPMAALIFKYTTIKKKNSKAKN
jgi:1,4-alpha-glucan branching enzyme